jgi:hypothetical protein
MKRERCKHNTKHTIPCCLSYKGSYYRLKWHVFWYRGLKPKEWFKGYNRVFMRKRYHLSHKAHTLHPRRGWAPSNNLRLWVPVGNPARIGLDLPLTTLVNVTRRRRNIITCIHMVQKQQGQKFEWLCSTRLICRDRMSWILDMQRLRSHTDSCLLASCTNHLLNMIISQVRLINRSRLATYANHAIVTHEVYEITFCHDYKIVNVIQVYTMQTITTSGVLRLNATNKPSSKFEDVAEIRINSQSCKENNLTKRHK